MIVLRKMNGDRFLVNHNQIECIELIPECKVVMMNHDYYLVRDTVEGWTPSRRLISVMVIPFP